MNVIPKAYEIIITEYRLYYISSKLFYQNDVY